MNKRRKSIFQLLFFILCILVVISLRFYEYQINRNFNLYAVIPCSPEENSCFMMDCDSNLDPECDVSTYMKVEILAHEAPKCLEEHTCEDFSCKSGSKNCSITFCSKEVLEEGEKCYTNIYAPKMLDTANNEVTKENEQK